MKVSGRSEVTIESCVFLSNVRRLSKDFALHVTMIIILINIIIMTNSIIHFSPIIHVINSVMFLLKLFKISSRAFFNPPHRKSKLDTTPSHSSLPPPPLPEPLTFKSARIADIVRFLLGLYVPVNMP